MTKNFAYFLFIFSMLQTGNICMAQRPIDTGGYKFISREQVIFEDDFSHDVIGKFPSRWHISLQSGINDSSNKQYFQVKKEKEIYALTVQKNAGFIEPNIDTVIFPEKFDLEYDFVLQSNGTHISLGICANPFNGPCGNLFFIVKNKEDKGICLEQLGWYQYFKGKDIEYPAHSDFTTWHHFRVNFDHGKIKCFIDKYRMIFISEGDYRPRRFSLGLCGPLKMKNFRIKATNYTFELSKILTEKKFVTHAINFDVNKSSIKPESIGFIQQLVEFLKANPTVKLEIDGHTDSDGDAAENIRLSQARADEVKKQLVTLGIDGNRLTAKGFGATKPLLPNTTSEGKAQNRRVEFIRL